MTTIINRMLLKKSIVDIIECGLKEQRKRYDCSSRVAVVASRSGVAIPTDRDVSILEKIVKPFKPTKL